MTIAHTNGATNGATSSSWSTGVHGITINDGDLVVIVSNANGAGHTFEVEAGFTDVVTDGIGGGESNTYNIQYLVAGGSEPTSYSGTISSSQLVTTIINVFTSTTGWATPALDAGPTLNAEESSASNAHLNTGITVADNSVAIATFFEDGGSGQANAVDNSYGGIESAVSGRTTATAFRIFTTGGATGDTTITSDNPTRLWHTQHLSFKESAGGGATEEHFLMTLGVGQ